MLNALKAALWKEDGDTGKNPVPPSPPLSVVATTVVGGPPPVQPLGNAALDPQILLQSQEAVFQINGSPYTRFQAEFQKLGMITDQGQRTLAALAVIGAQPGSLADALDTTHRGALEGWKNTISRAKHAKLESDVTGRQNNLDTIAANTASVQSEMAKLQQQLQDNAAKVATIQGEIATAQAEIEAKDRLYTGAIAQVQGELDANIRNLRSLPSN